VNIKIGKWHSGRWYIVKIVWIKEEVRLSSGFVISRDHDFVLSFVDDLKGKAGIKKQVS